LARKPAHPLKFFPGSLKIADHFENAMPGVAHGASDGHQLLLARRGSWNRLAIDGLVKDSARRGEPECTSADPVLHDASHLGYVFCSRDDARPLAITQHIGTHSTVRDMGAYVNRTRHPIQRVQVLGERLPIPFQALGQRGAGYVLDTFHQADQPIMLIRPGRCKTDATIADNDRRHPMPTRRRHLLVPSSLTVIMSVNVHKARRHNHSGRIDLLSTMAFDNPDVSDQPPVNRDIGSDRWLASSVHNQPAAHN